MFMNDSMQGLMDHKIRYHMWLFDGSFKLPGHKDMDIFKVMNMIGSINQYSFSM